jgi:hypothetical protein
MEPRVGRLMGWKSGEEYTWDLSEGAATRTVK